MLSRLIRSLCAVALVLTASPALADKADSAEPPAPDSHLPSIPACRAAGASRLVGSDAFAAGAVLEVPQQTCPLPELNPTPAGDCPGGCTSAVKMNWNVTVPCSEQQTAAEHPESKARLSFGRIIHTRGPALLDLHPPLGQPAEIPLQRVAGGPTLFDLHPPQAVTRPDGITGFLTFRDDKGSVLESGIFTAAPQPAWNRPDVAHWYLGRTPNAIQPATDLAQAAPDPSASPDDLTPLQHLQKAADHLEAAGRKEVAAHIRQQAEVMREHARRRLPELRKLQQHLLREIEELERLTGTSEQIQLQVSMLEVDEAKLAEFRADNDLSEDFALHSNATSVALPVEKAKEQFDRLRAAGVVKVLAEPTLITQNGREASIRSGGEFPILIPQNDGSVKVEFRDLGVRMTATPHLLGGDRLRLRLTPEFSERDFGNAVDVGGHRIPAVTTRRLTTDLQMNFGETVVIGGLQTSRRQTPLADRSPNLPEQLTHAIIQLAGGQLTNLATPAAATGNGKSFIVTATPTLVTPTP